MNLATKKQVRKSRIRAIDQGTLYDVTGKMKHLTRQIEQGKEGRVTDTVIIIRRDNGSIGSFHFGTGNPTVSHHLVSTVKNRLEPA